MKTNGVTQQHTGLPDSVKLLIEAAFDGRRFFQTPIEFLDVLGMRLGTFLAMVLSMYRVRCSSTRFSELEEKFRPDGWAKITDKEIIKSHVFLKGQRKVISKWIKALEKYGVLEVMRRGAPPQRFIRLRHDALLGILTGNLEGDPKAQKSAFNGRQNGTFKGRQKGPFLGMKKKPQGEALEHCPACRGTDWVGLAHLLGVTLAKFRKVTINDSKTKGWAKEISKAHTIDGMDPERITDDLKWYCDTLAKEGDLIRSNPGFFPIANAGDSFRKKILPIEDARARRMNRHKSHNSTKPIKNHGKILKGRASLDEW